VVQGEEIEKEPKLRRNLLLAYHLEKLFAENKAGAAQAAQWLNMQETKVHQLLNLLLLSPKIQEEILELPNQKICSIPEYKLRPIINEADWQKQGQMWQEFQNS